MQVDKKIFLRTAVAIALATAFNPVYAQEQELSDEQVEEAKTENDSTVEVIEVKGLRGSLLKAQDLKMNSDSILDAIVAEDIGKLPDNTAAESLARIPGVQVTRYNDEANAILIRGLPDVTTTYNGREFFTAEQRRGSLQDFSAEALAGIEVYKSATAELIEPGLAGLVNVRTRRPFDFEGEKIAGGFHYGYNDQSEEPNPAGSLLYSNRFKTDHGEFGFLVNATYNRSKYYNGVRYNTTWFDTAQPWWNIEEPYSDGGFVLPARVGLYNNNGTRTRPSANIALQWKPQDNLEIYFDGIYQGYRGENNEDNFWIPMTEWDWLNFDGTITDTTDVTLTNIVMNPDNPNQVQSLTKTGGIPPQIWRSTSKSFTNTYQFAGGFKYHGETYSIVSDIAWTDSEYQDQHWSFDTGVSFSPIVNVDFFGDGGVLFETTNWDVSDPDTYEIRGYFEDIYKVGGEGIQWRTDLEYNTGKDWLHTIQTGVRYSDRNATREAGNRYAGVWGNRLKVADLPFLDMQMTHDPFRTNQQGFTQYLAPTRGSIGANAELLQEFAYQTLTENEDPNAYRWAQDIEIDPAGDWLAEEKTYAFYVQGKSFFKVGEIGVDVFAGVRVARTESTSYGVSTVYFEGEKSLIDRTQSNAYTDILPNISTRIQLTDELQFRLGYTETRTKPNFGDLNPALNITQIIQPDIPNPNVEDPGFDAEGWGGNPDLKPLTSKNYDASLEYYFAETGYASFAAFYRDLWGFTNGYTRYIETPDYGTVRLNHPENAGEGKLKGWEVNLSTFLDFESLPEFLHPFGFSANMTQLEGENRLPLEDGTFGDFVKIPGLSKYTYNLAMFYEIDSFSARLSYNQREKWVNWYGATSPEGDFVGNQTENRDRLDLNLSYHIENYTFYFDIANILANPFKNYTVSDAGYRYPQDVRDEGRYFGAGIRFNF